MWLCEMQIRSDVHTFSEGNWHHRSDRHLDQSGVVSIASISSPLVHCSTQGAGPRHTGEGTQLVCCSHQPNYLPWLGLFHKVARSDTFVVHDEVLYSKGGLTNRNWIKGPNGPILLTVPVRRGSWNLPIAEVLINNDHDWRKKHVSSIEAGYRRAPYFDAYWPSMRAIYNCEWELLAKLNLSLIGLLLDILQISVRIVRGTELRVAGQKTERIVDVCKAVGASSYVSGKGAAHAYLDIGLMMANHIDVTVDSFDQQEYPQLWGDFVPNMSAIDIVFNIGPRAMEYIHDSEMISGAGG